MLHQRKNAIAVIVLLCLSLHVNAVFSQNNSRPRILVDISHGQKFYNDPSDMAGQDPGFVDRIKYMTGELEKNANALNAEIAYIKTEITKDDLSKDHLLFIHIPSKKFSADEVEAIGQFVRSGGSLFLVAEQDFWATLEQTNVNDIVSPFGIVFKGDNPDTESSGGYSKAGVITTQRYSIPYHGARMVEGGTSFCFSNATESNPFGVYKEVGNGGKIVAMGDGMVSLYMTSWKDVNNYQCSPFMQDVFAWLMK